MITPERREELYQKALDWEITGRDKAEISKSIMEDLEKEKNMPS